MLMAGNKAIFLDRDGTINKEKYYLYKISDFEYLEGAVEGLKKLSNIGYLLIVITNQSGIARGYYTEEDYQKLDLWMRKDLLEKGVKITASYYCPHLIDGSVAEYTKECECRKPKTKLFWKAKEKLNVDMARSFVIGDQLRDLAICKESEINGILLSNDLKYDGDYTLCRNWREIVNHIMFKGSSSA